MLEFQPYLTKHTKNWEPVDITIRKGLRQKEEK
jgi:hypothetical protein